MENISLDLLVIITAGKLCLQCRAVNIESNCFAAKYEGAPLISSGFKLQKMHFWSAEVPVWSSKEIVKITKISFNKVFNAKRQGRKS